MKAEEFGKHESESIRLPRSPITAARAAVMAAMLAGCSAPKTPANAPVDPLRMAQINSPEFINNMPERRLDFPRKGLEETGVLGVGLVDNQLEVGDYSKAELLALSLFVDNSSRLFIRPYNDRILEVGTTNEPILDYYLQTCPPNRAKCATEAEFVREFEGKYDRETVSMISPKIDLFEGAGSINYDAEASEENRISFCINIAKYFKTEDGKQFYAYIKQVPDQVRAEIRQMEADLSQQVDPSYARVIAEQAENMGVDSFFENYAETLAEIPDEYICRNIDWNPESGVYMEPLGENLALRNALMNSVLGQYQP